ncbi:MAG: tetratricopeptide repeat protein [Moorea sp. SIO3G5]|nr:tetratricopeptide repeat protein [Moorena sp. SIO3G5]
MQRLGHDHPDVATILNNLGLLYWSMGRYNQAKPLFVKALEIAEQKLGQNDPTAVCITIRYTGLFLLFPLPTSLFRTRPAWPTASVPAPNAPRVAHGLSPYKPRTLYLTEVQTAVILESIVKICKFCALLYGRRAVSFSTLKFMGEKSKAP